MDVATIVSYVELYASVAAAMVSAGLSWVASSVLFEADKAVKSAMEFGMYRFASGKESGMYRFEHAKLLDRSKKRAVKFLATSLALFGMSVAVVAASVHCINTSENNAKVVPAGQKQEERALPRNNGVQIQPKDPMTAMLYRQLAAVNTSTAKVPYIAVRMQPRPLAVR